MVIDNHFLVIGAQKSGTTWLQHVLDSDQGICTSIDQEVHYFNNADTLSLEAYQKKFRPTWKCQASVDVTPNYLDSSAALTQLKAFEEEYRVFPRIIVILREPVSRAFSAYQMFLNYGKSFDGFLDELQPGLDLYEKSLYAKYIQRWIDSGYKERLKIVLFDDLVSDPGSVLSGLSSFMGLDYDLNNSYSGYSINSGGIDRLKFVSLFRKHFGAILRKLGMHNLVHFLKKTKIVQGVDAFNKRKMFLGGDDREKSKSMFRDDVEKLDKMFPELEVKNRWGY